MDCLSFRAMQAACRCTLHGCVMRGQRIHNPGPDARPSPADKAIVAGGVKTKFTGRSRHGAPERRTQKMPLSTRRSFTRGTPRGLFGRNGLMAAPFIIREFVAHDSRLRLGMLNHAPGDANNPKPIAAVANAMFYFRFRGYTDMNWQAGRPGRSKMTRCGP